MVRLISLAIAVAGIGLMLPLPIRLSNFMPAWSVVLLAIGRTEGDGLCVLVGHLAVVGSWVYIGFTSTFTIGAFGTLLELFLV
jgi:hypothetical protein